MKIGVFFPQLEIGPDPIAIRDYAQTVEALGFSHLTVLDHVLGASAADRPHPMPYTEQSMLHELFVLEGYLAAVTSQVELVTGVLVMPQRQTVLIAKQCAEIDVLSGGRFRLGVGIGWNTVEFEALNESFKNRARRIEEQTDLLRRLWTEPLLEYHGKYHQIDRAGLRPLPVQRPIPIWFGGAAEPALQRLARIADGWMPNRLPPEGWPAAVARVRGYVSAAGRDVGAFGLQGRVVTARKTPDQWRAEAEEWRALNANYLDVDMMRGGLQGPQAHIDQLRQVKEALSV